MSKPQIISDKNKKSLKIKNILIKKIEEEVISQELFKNIINNWSKLYSLKQKIF